MWLIRSLARKGVWCSNKSEVVNPVTHLKLLLVHLQYLWLIVIALISLFAVDHCFPHFTHSQLMHNTYTCCHTQLSHSILHFTNFIVLAPSMDASLQIQTHIDMSSPAVVSALSAMATSHPQNVA